MNPPGAPDAATSAPAGDGQAARLYLLRCEAPTFAGWLAARHVDADALTPEQRGALEGEFKAGALEALERDLAAVCPPGLEPLRDSLAAEPDMTITKGRDRFRAELAKLREAKASAAPVVDLATSVINAYGLQVGDVPGWIFTAPGLSLLERSVLARCHSSADQDGAAWPAGAALASELSCAALEVKAEEIDQALESLVAKGQLHLGTAGEGPGPYLLASGPGEGDASV